MSTDEQIPEDDSVCFYCGCPDCRCDELPDDEPDYEEDEMANCHGFFESQSPHAVFVCGAVGSEDCDECPCYAWLGLTNQQIDDLDTFEGELL